MNLLDLLAKPGAYAGIGSRKTPADVLDLMTRIARKLDAMGWTLRSGGADGADTAFTKDAPHAQIFIPWPGFNGIVYCWSNRPSPNAFLIAAKHHPAWEFQSDVAKKLHARNVHQVLGDDCASPSAFVLCWTPDGSTGITTARTGGTGQAIRVAHAYGVPIFNLQREDHRKAWEGLCNE